MFNIKNITKYVTIFGSLLFFVIFSREAEAYSFCMSGTFPHLYPPQCPASCGESASGTYCNSEVVTRSRKVPAGKKEVCTTKCGTCRRCENFGDYHWCYNYPCCWESCRYKPRYVTEYYNVTCFSCWSNCCTICNPGDCGTCNSNSWSDTSSCTKPCGGGTKTQENECGGTRTVACNTQSCSVDVEGYIWDATDLDCDASKSVNEITDADVEGTITPTIDGQDGTWDTDLSGKNYEITGVDVGNNKALSANPNADSDLFKYKLKCLNNGTSGVVGNSAIINVNSDVTAHLGYELISSGWFQAIGGGIYAGGDSIESVSVGLPGTASGDFTNYLIDGPGSLITNTLFSVKDTEDTDRIVDNEGNSGDNNDYYYEGVGEDADFWPTYFNFDIPNEATSINTGDLTSGLTAGEDYTLGSSPGDVSGTYTVDGDGVAIVYVDGPLNFDDNFRSSDDNRILFVVNDSVSIEASIGTDAPTTSTQPHIEAGIIAKGSIDFETTGSEDDLTIIVESPLVAKDGSVSFSRDRGLENGYPAVVVKHNPTYMSKASDSSVSLIDILWTLE